MSDYTIAVKYAMFFFMITMFIEWLSSKFLKQKVYNLPDTISSISSGMTNNLKSILKLTVVIISYQWMYEHLAVFYIEASWWVYLIAFIGIDFANYWTHRWNHEFNILWNRHIIHHSSEEYNLACALRQSISSIIQIYFFLYIPLAVIGIPGKVMSILLPLHLFAQFWYHTRLINKMGFLEKIIVTPSHHRVHHAVNDIYIDKNYSAIFIFWDFIFGTFQAELKNEPPVYGIKKPANTWNPIIINYMHLFQLFKDAFRTKKWKDKFRIWFMPTGWRPNDVESKYPIISSNFENKKKYQTSTTTFLNLWSSLQLLIHLGMQFHIIYLISYFDISLHSTYGIFSAVEILMLYGLFFVSSIAAFTSLMDNSFHSLITETLKNLIGFSLLIYFPEVLNIYRDIEIPFILPVVYLILSQSITVYFTIKFSKDKKLTFSL